MSCVNKVLLREEAKKVLHDSIVVNKDDDSRSTPEAQQRNGGREE